MNFEPISYLKRSIQLVLLVLMAAVSLQSLGQNQDFNYLSLQKSPGRDVIRVYPGDSLSLEWNGSLVSGEVTSISDSIVSLNQIPYRLDEIQTVYVRRRSWGRQVLESAPGKVIQFGALLFIYGHLNRLVLEGKIIDEGLYNAEILISTVLPAALLKGILVSTQFRKFHPAKNRVKPVVFN
jgi:hypothetical protein